MNHPSSASLLLSTCTVALLAGACTTTPVAPLPQPLPETLEWAREETKDGAFLGLEVRENLSGSFDALDFPPGVKVASVADGSPAAGAGVRAGDVLLRFDGEPTDEPETLAALLARRSGGSEVALEVQRGDTVFEVPVRLRAPAGATAAAATPVARLDPARSRAGWSTGRGGVVLVASHPEAPFPRAGVRVGSVVHAIDGEAVHSGRALLRRLQAYEPGSTVEVEFTPAVEDDENGASAADGGAARRTARVRLQDQPRRVTRLAVPILFGYEADVDGEETSFVLIDLYVISLFRYERIGAERRWSFLRFFRFATGVGELGE